MCIAKNIIILSPSPLLTDHHLTPPCPHQHQFSTPDLSALLLLFSVILPSLSLTDLLLHQTQIIVASYHCVHFIIITNKLFLLFIQNLVYNSNVGIILKHSVIRIKNLKKQITCSPSQFAGQQQLSSLGGCHWLSA